MSNVTFTYKIKALRYILKSRLPDIKRWLFADVYGPKDKKRAYKNKYVKEYFNDNGEFFYTCYWGHKSDTNHNQFELKEIPIKDIDSLIAKNSIRLKDKAKPYK